jgi:hypothetical protein
MKRELCLGLSVCVVTVFLGACSTVSATYPPPVNPFLSGAPALAKTSAVQPTRAALIWLEPQGIPAPPEAAQRALAEKIKNAFPAGKPLQIVGVAAIPVPPGDPLAEIRKASAPFNVREALVVMPNASEVNSPVWLKYGQNGSGPGTRTDSFISITLVAVNLDTGAKRFAVVSNGEAALLKMDHEDARPFYPRISPERSSAFIYPKEGNPFPPGEVRAVALEQAVNRLIYELNQAIGS